MNNKLYNKFAVIGILMTILFFVDINIASANSLESEFKSTIKSYAKEDLIVEDGVVLNLGESLDLSKYPNWTLSNNDVVVIDEKGIVKAENEGTVFLSQKIGEKVYVIEIYVQDNNNSKLYTKNPKISDNEKYRVFIDPGHGGSDPGASGFGRKEADINLQVSLKLKSRLESKGIEVVMSRTTDEFLPLKERANLANKSGAHVFVSIHQNSFSSESANGIETYYHPDKTSYKELSTEIQNNAINETGAKNRGVKTENFAVVRLTDMASALVECGFITNKSESDKLASEAYQDKLATGISIGIENYLKNNIQLSKPDLIFKDISEHWAKDTILEFVEKEYIDGYEDNTFRPNNGITRAEFIKIVNKFFNLTKESDINFSDVKADEWYYKDLRIAVEAGYINGYEDNTFRPYENITRQEVAKIISKVKDFKGGEELKFKDSNNISSWAKDYVIALVSNDIINGYEDNTFRPLNNVTRAEAVTILSRIED